jgi:hypothetical protein
LVHRSRRRVRGRWLGGGRPVTRRRVGYVDRRRLLLVAGWCVTARCGRRGRLVGRHRRGSVGAPSLDDPIELCFQLRCVRHGERIAGDVDALTDHGIVRLAVDEPRDLLDPMFRGDVTVEKLNDRLDGPLDRLEEVAR